MLLFLSADQGSLQTTGNIMLSWSSFYLEIAVKPLDNRKYQALLLLCLPADQWSLQTTGVLNPVAPWFTDQWSLQTTGNIRPCCSFVYLQISEASRQQEILGPVAPLFTCRSVKPPDNGKYLALLLLCLPGDQEASRQQEILCSIAPLFTFRSEKPPDNRKY